MSENSKMLLIASILPLVLSQGIIGSWDIIGTSGVVCIHTMLLPNSKLLCMERPHMPPYSINSQTNGNTVIEIDLKGGQPIDGSWQATWQQKPTIFNTFCAGHVQLGNGSILVIGGDNQSMAMNGVDYIVDGRATRQIYDPVSGSWNYLPHMTTNRWYPTVVTMKDGNAIIFSGTTANLDFDLVDKGENNNNPTYEYWPAKSGNWPMELDILKWAYPHVLYPMAFQLPSGGIFLLVSNKTIIIDPETDQISYSVPDMPAMDHSPWIYPHSPHMIMLPLSKDTGYKGILQICGGSTLAVTDDISDKPASPMCWRINPDERNPTWTRADDMPHARVMLDGILLPGILFRLNKDGKILYLNGAAFGVAGGNQGQVMYARDPVFAVDLHDPFAPSGKQWTSLANASIARMYHDGALLLETGHVITFGSEMKNYMDYYPFRKSSLCFPATEKVCSDAFEYRIERFTPPYLLTGKPRPVIKEAPTFLTHDSIFSIGMESPDPVDRVTFIRYSTTTHNLNTDQRFIELEIVGKLGSTIYLHMPPNSAIAPPGNWHLFALSQGVPSVSKTVNLQNGAATRIEIPKAARNGSKSFSRYLWILFILLAIL